MKRRKPLERRTKLRPQNPKRLKARRAIQFGRQAELCRLLPCCACGFPPPSQPAHVRSRGAGGKDEDTVPLCGTGMYGNSSRYLREGCHDKQHREGVLTFGARVGVDLAERAAAIRALVRAKPGRSLEALVDAYMRWMDGG